MIFPDEYMQVAGHLAETLRVVKRFESPVHQVFQEADASVLTVQDVMYPHMQGLWPELTEKEFHKVLTMAYNSSVKVLQDDLEQLDSMGMTLDKTVNSNINPETGMDDTEVEYAELQADVHDDFAWQVVLGAFHGLLKMCDQVACYGKICELVTDITLPDECPGAVTAHLFLASSQPDPQPSV